MANSVHQDRHGPDWPVGNIVVAAAGTPVNIMSLVDATSVNAPETASSSQTAEYTMRAQQIIFQALKAGAGPPALANNTGLLYIIRKGAGGGTGNKTDLGTIIKVLAPGETWVLGSSAQVRNVFDPYRYFVDADTSGDACQVTLIIQ